MPLLECGRIVRDSWQKLADDAALPSAHCILNLSRLQQDDDPAGLSPDDVTLVIAVLRVDN